MKQRFRVVVDFESETQPLRSYRGEFFVNKPQTAAFRGLVAASKKHLGCHWTSAVVLLDKLDRSPSLDVGMATPTETANSVKDSD